MENPQISLEKKKCKSLQWRYWTMWAAYFDLAVLSVGLATGVYFIVRRVTDYVDGVDSFWENEHEQTEEEKRYAVRLRFAKDVAITLLVSLSMLGIWATTRLLAATEHCNAKDALEMATIWRNVKITIIAFTMVALFNNNNTYYATCGVAVWHAIGFYLGCQFTHELEMTLSDEILGEDKKEGKKLKPTDDSKVTVPNISDKEVHSKLIVESA